MRRWDVPYSPNRRERLRAFYSGWSNWAASLDYDGLGLEGAIDHTLFTNLLAYELKLLEREESLAEEMGSLAPFAGSIIDLQEKRRAFDFTPAEEAAETLAQLPLEISYIRDSLEVALDAEEVPSRIIALRVTNWISDLTDTLESWYSFYAGYDPIFTWWNEQPYQKATSALADYRQFLEEEIIGFRDGEDPPIVGDPIGKNGLADDLAKEMIPYSPEELIAIAQTEFAWCERELLLASRELGYGDDWRAAQEYVKSLYVEPGQQIALVRDLAFEAVEFLESRELVTIPPVAKEVWRMEMLSPERQKIAPFFLGGEVVQVAFPTNTMEHADKLMSLRGNNEHYSRAVVHHELIPGHHLQGFMTSRYNVHRRIFGTPFWGEGWALYWEMLLWDEGFPQSAEDKVGMLFWRMHRAARIIFSLGFHLGEMTPEEAIDFLVDRVGHERANATAEVRRSFNGTYSPLYQAAYMLGGIQLRGLHTELVSSGKMTNRDFHDAILQGGRMPIEMVRARLTGQPPGADFESTWRFYD
ncbi:MAG: DUF885 family protein [Rhodothermales bacterium]|nr:DUF885 family protein [Rhodothermales bacterium]